jgi:prepilin-type N-terminal cleavage/methylation domain-containing protein
MKKSEAGFTFIEVLIALMIIVILAGAFLNGVAYSSRAVMLADGRATAEALAKSEIEYIKMQTYLPYISYTLGGDAPIGTRPGSGGNLLPPGYSLSVTSGPAGEYGEYDVADMQQVSVKITRGAPAQPWLHVDYTLTDYWRKP